MIKSPSPATHDSPKLPWLTAIATVSSSQILLPSALTIYSSSTKTYKEAIVSPLFHDCVSQMLFPLLEHPPFFLSTLFPLTATHLSRINSDNISTNLVPKCSMKLYQSIEIVHLIILIPCQTILYLSIQTTLYLPLYFRILAQRLVHVR